jgi:hypothetical protein
MRTMVNFPGFLRFVGAVSLYRLKESFTLRPQDPNPVQQDCADESRENGKIHHGAHRWTSQHKVHLVLRLLQVQGTLQILVCPPQVPEDMPQEGQGQRALVTTFLVTT